MLINYDQHGRKIFESLYIILHQFEFVKKINLCCLKTVRCVTVDRPERKPCCSFMITLLSMGYDFELIIFCNYLWKDEHNCNGR